MKKIKFKWIIIGIDIIVIIAILLIKFNVFSLKNNNSNEISDDIVEEANNILTFKEFTFELPEDIYITNIGDDTFTIDNENKWEATIEIFLNDENGIFKYPDRWETQTLSYGDNVNHYEYMTIGSYDVLVYKRPDESSMLCYLVGTSPFAYEIDIYNISSNYEENLMEVINVLFNSKYNKTDEYKYHKVVITEEKIIIEEENS